MHMAVIGLFGQHKCNSIAHKSTPSLRNDHLATTQLQDDGTTKIKYVISDAALEAVHGSLCERLEHFQLSNAGFQLT